MGGGFNRRKHIDTNKIRPHPPVIDIFRNPQCLGFFKLLKGYDDEVAQDFAVALHSQAYDSVTTVVRGLEITITLEIISRVTTLPLGFKWNR